MNTKLSEMPLQEIGAVISKEWKNPYFGAVPYINALIEIDGQGKYFEDDWRSITLYFLSNAKSWRGEIARTIKHELNRRLKANAIHG